MALVALDGTPLVIVGAPSIEGRPVLPTAMNTTLDAVNEAVIMVGQIFTEDGASHTIDTTGSSSLGWRAGTSTFANAGTTLKVGLAALDATAGPPVRAANASDVVTLDVSKTLTGGSGLTSNAWNEHVPDAGSKTIANSGFVAFCVQMTTRGGADNVIVQTGVVTNNTVMPTVTGFVGAAYANQGSIPNAVITFSDGTLGFFFGGAVFATISTTQTWNNGSATKEYGNFFQMPAPVKVYGLAASSSIGGDTDLVLYSDPLGTPAAQRTVSLDANAIGAAAVSRWLAVLFASPYEATANQPLAGIIKPTTATNISAVYKTFNVSAHQKAETLGTNGYAINRNAGAFAAQNSNKDRFAIGLLVGALDNGASGFSPLVGPFH